MNKTKPTPKQLFWVWRNSWFHERQRKAQWAYDLVKGSNEPKEDILELLEDLIAQSERSMTFESIFIAQNHGHDSTRQALSNYGCPEIFIKHLEDCTECHKTWTARYEELKNEFSDKQPY